jgi:hypothetical protein
VGVGLHLNSSAADADRILATLRMAGETANRTNPLERPRPFRVLPCFATTLMKATALLLSGLFVAGVIGADYCFGQLLKRGYEVAPDDWERAGRPTWWTWKPPEMMLPRWYHSAPRWRWIWSGPPWVRTDHVSRSLQIGHRLLVMLTLVAWVAGLIVFAIVSNSK